MSTGRRFLIAASLVSFVALSAPAQSVTSARSGTLHYFEGDISLNGEPLQWKASKFPEVKDGMVLRSAIGRAEVLLTPGVFLRMGENTAIRMIDSRLATTRVELISGTIAVESDDPRTSVKNAPVTVVLADRELRLVKSGLTEMTTEPFEVRVFKGEAEVSSSPQAVLVKDGRLLTFSDGPVVAKFDTRTADDLYLWTRDRSRQLSAASMASANSLSDWKGGWYYNPNLNMYTLVPAGGTSWSPFGNGFFSPGTIGDYYAPTAYWYGGATRGAAAGGQALMTGQVPGTRISSPIAASRGGEIQVPVSGSPMRGGFGSGGAAPQPGGIGGGFGSAPIAGGGFGGGAVASAPAGGIATAGPRGR